MSREILEAVRGLAAEKNISSEKLMEALEDHDDVLDRRGRRQCVLRPGGMNRTSGQHCSGSGSGAEQ